MCRVPPLLLKGGQGLGMESWRRERAQRGGEGGSRRGRERDGRAQRPKARGDASTALTTPALPAHTAYPPPTAPLCLRQ
eukprot:scaffold176467_cov21-Tisochrysis_lutea.AAC.1